MIKYPKSLIRQGSLKNTNTTSSVKLISPSVTAWLHLFKYSTLSSLCCNLFPSHRGSKFKGLDARSDMMFILSSGVNWTKSKSTFPIILHTSYFSSNNSNFDHVSSGIFYLNSSLNNFVLGVLLGHYPRHLAHTLWVDNKELLHWPYHYWQSLIPWDVS